MGSCLGKLSSPTSGQEQRRGSNLECRSPTAAPESLTDTVCGLQQQQKQKRSGGSLEEIVNQLIRETLVVIGSIVEK